MSKDFEKLKQSNNELREIVNNSWDGIGIIDKQSKFIYVNNAFSPILGFSKDEFLDTTFLSLIENDYKNAFTQLMHQNVINKYSSEVQVVCKRKDNQKVYLQITIALMLNEKFFVVNAKDITKQISDDEILDNYVISSHIDREGNIQKISKAFCLLSGYKQEELIDKNISIIRHPDNEKKFLDKLWITINNGEQWSGNIKNIKKDGSSFWVNAKIKPMYNKYGDITGFTSLMFDITNELKQQDKILVQQSKLAIMAETLQMVSHEWRQPLNIISIQAQKVELDYSLDGDLDNDEVVQTLNNIKEKANELSNTIEDFQSFVKLKSEKSTVDPLDIIERAVEIFKKDSPNDDIDFEKDTVETPKFETYMNELTTILVNILVNAKEAIIRNNTKHGVIKLKEYFIDNTIFFEISDNGGGVDKDVIDNIFEPYFSTKELQHGVGLGLYMCKIIIEMHFNGRIEVHNHNTGATFKIALPMN